MMRRPKKNISTLLLIAAITSLTACNGGGGSSQGPSNDTTSQGTPKKQYQSTYVPAGGKFRFDSHFAWNNESSLVVIRASVIQPEVNVPLHFHTWTANVGFIGGNQDFVEGCKPFYETENETQECEKKLNASGTSDFDREFCLSIIKLNSDWMRRTANLEGAVLKSQPEWIPEDALFDFARDDLRAKVPVELRAVFDRAVTSVYVPQLRIHWETVNLSKYFSSDWFTLRDPDYWLGLQAKRVNLGFLCDLNNQKFTVSLVNPKSDLEIPLRFVIQ